MSVSVSAEKKEAIVTTFKANMLPVLIGSLPIADHDEAFHMVLESTPEVPLWVQLPMYANEGMMVQFVSGIPGVIEEDGRVFIDTSDPSFEDNVLKFYEDYLMVTDGGAPLDSTRFAMTKETAKGFHTLLETIEKTSELPTALKGQVTGPVTLATGLTDQNRRALFYDDRLLDIVVKTLAMKARFQVEKMSQFGIPAIVFIDEPALAGFGTSAFISISSEDVQRVLGEVIEAIHGAGGLAGVHVCANTDWSLILDSNADILSFDAYGFFDRLALYEESLKRFFDQGRCLAWGIVPTSDTSEIDQVTTSSLVSKLESQIAHLEAMGIDHATILAQSLVTPSCGTGSLPPDYAAKVLRMTREVSQALRSKS